MEMNNFVTYGTPKVCETGAPTTNLKNDKIDGRSAADVDVGR